MSDTYPKLVMLFYGIVAFAAVVGILLLTLERMLHVLQERWVAFGLIAPAGALLVIGLIIPALRTFALSFEDGFSDYRWLFTNPESLGVLFNSLLWVLLVPTVSTAIGVTYAVLVDRTRFESFAKSLIFMPMAISFVGAGIIWKFVYAYRPAEEKQIGLLNQVVVWLGGEPHEWLITGPWNTLFMIVVLIWVQSGFAMVVLSAAVKGIPVEIAEAARLDGVSGRQMFWRVTIPSIRPSLIVVLLTITIGTLKVFDIVVAMTGGQFGTTVLANEMYNQAFRYYDDGKGAAIAVFMFVLMLPVVIYQARRVKR